MGEDFPKLRAIEAFPVQHNKQTLICLRDPLRFSDNVITVSPGAGLILQCLDGKHSLVDIQSKFAQATSQILSSEDLTGFLQKLDQALMLESPRFRKHKKNLIEKFRLSPIRPASHAGASYPAQAEAIEAMFAKHFEAPAGPGPNGRSSAAPPVAIVSPHIDLRRGGPGFAWAYGQLRDAPRVDTFVILGVAHFPTRNRFAGTKKHFQTPLGLAKTDQRFMDSLAAKLPFDLFEDEFAHRSEHSVEFQVVYLQHILRKRYEFEIAPVLVGSFQDLVASGQQPIGDEAVRAFSQSLRETIQASGKRICVVAGVDLAHVGGRFGDEFTVNEDVRAEIESDDRAMLDILEKCDAPGFFKFIHEEQDRRRVCGFPTLYTLLSALDVKEGKLLYYDQSFEKDTNSVVSFASMRFQ